MAECTGSGCVMDQAAAFDFTVRRGDTFTYQLAFSTYATNQTAADAVPRDITSSTFAMQVRKNGTIALDISTSNNRMQVIAPNLLNIVVSGQDMRIPAGEYLYDLEETALGDLVSTHMQGTFRVVADVTQL